MNRERLLREMGLGPVWQLQDGWRQRLESAAPAMQAAAPDQDLPASDEGQGLPSSAVEVLPAATPVAAAAPAVGSEAQGVPAAASVPVADGRAARIAALDWDDLIADIRSCTACGLCSSRTQAVPGVGDRSARWLVVGEAPGADEDRLGEPFVGKAGQLLDNMLAALSLRRGQGVYIANVLKCRPPNNRDPLPAEVAACRHYLQRQIELIQPALILCVGRHAANTLLGIDEAVGRLRGRVHDLQGIPLVVTWHPAYLLRSPSEKARAWQDLVLAQRTLAARPQN